MSSDILVFGDSLGVMVAGYGSLSSRAKGGSPSSWVLDTIKNNGAQSANQNIILSTGASNDALNITAAWLKINGREGAVLTSRDIQSIRNSREYRLFEQNVERQITSLLNNGASNIYIMGVASGPADVPNYVERRTVGYAPGGIFNMLGVNNDLSRIVGDYTRRHPEMAGRIRFGGPMLNPTADAIHPSDTASQEIITRARSFFQGHRSELIHKPADQSPAFTQLPQIRRDSPPAHDQTAAADRDRVCTAADSGEALFATNSASLTPEQAIRLKNYFVRKLRQAKANGTLGRLKVTLVASADGTGSEAVNMRLSRDRLKIEHAVLQSAEDEAGVTLNSQNITTRVLGRQGALDKVDQSKRYAAAAFAV